MQIINCTILGKKKRGLVPDHIIELKRYVKKLFDRGICYSLEKFGDQIIIILL